MPVVAVTESQQVDAAGLLTDVYEVTFTITGRPGAFTVTVPKEGDVIANARAALQETYGIVEGIYGL